MNWTNFKEKYLFTINFHLVLGIILFGVRRDFSLHGLILGLLALALFSQRVRRTEEKLLHHFGKINSILILSLFYFLVMTPFSLFYRLFFRNNAFKKNSSRFVPKESISDFNRPF